MAKQTVVNSKNMFFATNRNYEHCRPNSMNRHRACHTNNHHRTSTEGVKGTRACAHALSGPGINEKRHNILSSVVIRGRRLQPSLTGGSQSRHLLNRKTVNRSFRRVNDQTSRSIESRLPILISEFNGRGFG